MYKMVVVEIVKVISGREVRETPVGAGLRGSGSVSRKLPGYLDAVLTSPTGWINRAHRNKIVENGL